jgi:hypothetical protein
MSSVSIEVIRLPAGKTNNLFTDPLPGLEYTGRPRKPWDFYRHAARSLRAIALIEHHDLTVANAGVEPCVYLQPGEVQTIPIPAPHALAEYTHGIDPETGQLQQLVKVQPRLAIPDIADERLSTEDQMRLFSEYRHRVAHPRNSAGRAFSQKA